MRVGPVGQVSVYGSPKSAFDLRVAAASKGLKKHGAIILEHTMEDYRVIEALEKRYGKGALDVERSRTVKVKLKDNPA